MAQLQNIMNLIKCGADGVLGTGMKGCKPFLKKTSALWLTPAGFVFDKTVEFTEEYIKTLQAEGNLIILKGIRTFTDNSADDKIDELEDGTKQVATLGLYEMMVNFINGLHFHAALHSLSGYGDYDITMVDREGNIFGTKASDGSLKGFSAGMIQASRLTWPTDTQAQREGLAFQLLERLELDKDWAMIQGKSLDFNPQMRDGVNEIEVSYAVAPADAATSISVKAVRKQDGKAFTGAAFGDFNVQVNNTTSNPTAGDDSAVAGTYVLTIAAIALNDVVETSLYDNANNRPAIELDGELYKSNTVSATVI